MGNKKLSTDMARYIWSIIAKEPLLPMSWGVDLETVVCSEDALEFHVQGFLHTGNVRIVYIEGADIFQVWRKRSIPTHSEWLYPLTFDAGNGLKEA